MNMLSFPRTRFALLISVCALTGCDFLFHDGNGHGDMGTIRFGDTYEIRTVDPLSGDPIRPELTDSTLHVTVAYSGGCKEHEFTLNQRTAGEESLQVWIFHNGNNDLCEAYPSENLALAHTIDIDSFAAITLLNPNGDPFALK